MLRHLSRACWPILAQRSLLQGCRISRKPCANLVFKRPIVGWLISKKNSIDKNMVVTNNFNKENPIGDYKPNEENKMENKKPEKIEILTRIKPVIIPEIYYRNRIIKSDPRVKHVTSAIREGKYQMAKKFAIAQHICVDAHDDTSLTPLIEAVIRDDVKGINFLVTQMNASLYASDGFSSLRKTPLHYAAYWEKKKALCELLKLGMNPNVLNMEDKSPLDETKNLEIIEILSDAGCLYGKELVSIFYPNAN
ncbi:MAG: hypothetical protein Edafosvirus43_4 [Edafosvirus sp.]|uniref:Uncharacterized protein n=1 Tax=Edafosvirus sp. TaxID=2487765 RepID=A0A3G4ZZ74_9VIRU|nr:MAG: hypothetical protein Edafosvirus43_4 [Edafosvirus sp.]